MNPTNDWAVVTLLRHWPVSDASDLDWVSMWPSKRMRLRYSTMGCSTVHFSTLR